MLGGPQPDRRHILGGVGACVAIGMVTAHRVLADDQISLPATAAAPASSPQYDSTLKRILGDATAVIDRVRVEIPDEVENGSIVPYRLEVDSPMSERDSIRRVHLLSMANPQALVATFVFSPLSAKAVVIGRMRLAKSQQVVALAETSDGSFLIGQKMVQVAVGGCGIE